MSITTWKGPEAKITDIVVRPDGKISHTFLEDLTVSGLTSTEIDDLMTEKLREFVKSPRVDVLVKEYNSKKAALFGEIANLAGRPLSGPNIYPLKGKTTLLDLILTAGGQTEQGDLSRVELVRRGKLHKLNLVKALFGEEEQREVILDAEDRIFVPRLRELEEKRILVLGEVASPGLFTFKEETTLLDAVAKAGGPTAKAIQDDVHIIKGDANNPELIKVDLKRLLLQGDMGQNYVLNSKDIVYVPKKRLYKAREWVETMSPIFDFLLRPGIFRDTYTTGGTFLKFDTGGVRERAPAVTIIGR